MDGTYANDEGEIFSIWVHKCSLFGSLPTTSKLYYPLVQHSMILGTNLKHSAGTILFQRTSRNNKMLRFFQASFAAK
jgi:hypothetical protein